MASRNGIHSALVEAEKGKFWGLDIVSQNCDLENKLTQTKIGDLVSIFSGEVTSNTDTSYCIHILLEVCPSVFFDHPVYCHNKMSHGKSYNLQHP